MRPCLHDRECQGDAVILIWLVGFAVILIWLVGIAVICYFGVRQAWSRSKLFLHIPYLIGPA